MESFLSSNPYLSQIGKNYSDRMRSISSGRPRIILGGRNDDSGQPLDNKVEKHDENDRKKTKKVDKSPKSDDDEPKSISSLGKKIMLVNEDFTDSEIEKVETNDKPVEVKERGRAKPILKRIPKEGPERDNHNKKKYDILVERLSKPNSRQKKELSRLDDILSKNKDEKDFVKAQKIARNEVNMIRKALLLKKFRDANEAKEEEQEEN